jgi:hypothetical protein
VYGVTTAGHEGWGSGTALACIGTGAVLLALFIGIERRSAAPLAAAG